MTIEDKKITAKEALLLAAEKLFTEQGYAAVSTRELADEAQVNLGAIQYHFGSKEALFIETVRRLMLARNQANEILSKSSDVKTADEAARELTFFFHAFLKDVCQPCGPNVCKLMYREVLDTTSQEGEMFKTLVSLVVNEFITPVDDHLRRMIKLIRPHANEVEINLIIHSIIGQCSFYVTHRPFIEKLRDVSLNGENVFANIAEQIATFTLRGLGLSEEKIQQAVSKG